MRKELAPGRVKAGRLVLALPVLLLSGISACEVDQDQDGWSESDGDCDDQTPATYPGADELCDGQDNDCDGQVDEDIAAGSWYEDRDGDGYGNEEVATVAGCPGPDGYAMLRGDCDEADAAFYPGAADPAGDGLDQDCGGADGQQPSVGLPTSSYSSIAAAVAAAAGSGLTVWVGPGQYDEHDLSPHGIQLASTGGAERTVIDAGQQGRVMEFLVVMQTTVDGFTLTGGLALDNETDEDSGHGGAVYLWRSEPTLRHCVISGSEAELGGGLYLDASDPILEDCTITGNQALVGSGLYLYQASPMMTSCTISENYGGNYGGGIHITSTSEPILSDCDVTNNKAASAGGGLMSSYDSNPNLITCIISGNSSDYVGGGAYFEGSSGQIQSCLFLNNIASMDGGGLNTNASSLDIRDTRFVENSASERGGGVEIGAFSTISNCSFSGNSARYGGAIHIYGTSPTLTNCTFFDNVASYGGAVYLAITYATLSHCSITGNQAQYGGGIYLKQGYPDCEPYDCTAPVVTAGIMAYNSGGNVYNEPGYPGTVALTYSDLYNPPGELNHNLSGLDATNLTIEPGFLSYDDAGMPSDLHLALGSPLVDAGDPSLMDADGSRSDPGSYGGEAGDAWDLDADGYPDYFWPGTLEDSPAGFDAADYDCDDGNPSRWHCGG